MFKNLFKKPALFVFAALGAILWGCGGSQTPYSPAIVGTTSGPTTDFTMSVSPTTASLQSALSTKTRVGQVARFTVTVTPSQTFRGAVNLTVANPNTTKFNAGFDKSTLTFNDSNPQNAVLSVTLNVDNGQLGNFNFVITGTSANTTASQTVTVDVTANASFNLGVVPARQNIPNGALPAKSSRPGTQIQPVSVTFQVNVSPTPDFRGTVQLTVSNPTPPLFSASFSKPSLTFTSAASQTSNLIVTRIVPTSETGDNVFTVTAKSGSITKTATATVTLVKTVPGFTVSLIPTKVTVQDGQSEFTSGQFAVQVTPVGGFSGLVTLSGIAQGPTFGFNPSTIQMDGVHSFDSVLTLTVDNDGDLGDNNFTVKGTGNGLTSSANGDLLIVRSPASDFTLTVTPDPQTITLPGQGSAACLVTLNAGASFSGTVNLSMAGNPDANTFTTSFSPPSLTLTPGLQRTTTLTFTTKPTAGAATYPFLVQATSGTLTHTTEEDLTIQNAVEKASRRR
jgi:hypothetical protein